VSLPIAPPIDQPARAGKSPSPKRTAAAGPNENR
jgi:hypothetical protein